MDCIERCLRTSLQADRAAYRRTRTRLASAEGTLAHALRDWSDEGEPGGRAALRGYARYHVQRVRTLRRRLASIASLLASTTAAYRAARSRELT